MTRKERNIFYNGARVALVLGEFDMVIDYAEIDRLNMVSANSWVSGNNSGDAAYMTKMDNKGRKAYDKAAKIAQKHGWKISQPGLYWDVIDANNQIIGR